MKDIAKRFAENPLLSPTDLQSSDKGLQISCLLNPGVFQYKDKTWLIVRVAERPGQKDNTISFPILTETGTTEIIEIAKDDPALIATDERVINYKGVDYLTTLSHLRLLCSDDGIRFHMLVSRFAARAPRSTRIRCRRLRLHYRRTPSEKYLN